MKNKYKIDTAIVILNVIFSVYSQECQIDCPAGNDGKDIMVCTFDVNKKTYKMFPGRCAMDGYANCHDSDFVKTPLRFCIKEHLSLTRRMYGESCPVFCPSHYKPVCGASKYRDYVYRTFNNGCYLDMINCRGDEDYSDTLITMGVIHYILVSALVAIGASQRPSYAGRSPIGYPRIEATSTATTQSGTVGNRFDGNSTVATNITTTTNLTTPTNVSTTTERLPIEALGDRDLVNRLKTLPTDKQPFWLLNWRALETHRQSPQSFSQRPNIFAKDISLNENIIPAQNNQQSIENNQSRFQNNPSIPNTQLPLQNNQGFPNAQLPLQNNQGFPNAQLPLQNNQGFPNTQLPLQNNQVFANTHQPLQNNASFPNTQQAFLNNRGFPNSQQPVQNNQGFLSNQPPFQNNPGLVRANNNQPRFRSNSYPEDIDEYNYY